MSAYASVAFGIGLGLALAGLWSRFGGWMSSAISRFRSRGQPSRFTAVHADEIEWRQNEAHRAETTFFMKPLPRSGTTDDVLMLVRYPAGEINPEHVHPVGHGMYVLQGELVTHRGTFRPNTFVWFPANEVMWHGAGPEEDLVVLFSAGPNMTTRYRREQVAQTIT